MFGDSPFHPRALMSAAAPGLSAGSLVSWWATALTVAGSVVALDLRALVHPGYLVQVDTAFGPLGVLGGDHPATPFDAVAGLLVRLVGPAAGGRVIAVVAVGLCVLAPMVLLRRKPWTVRVVGGLLGALNPFVYERLVEGQWAFLISLACLVLWLAAAEAVVDRPGPRTAAVLGAAGCAAVLADAHIAGPLAVLAAAAFVGWAAWRRRKVRTGLGVGVAAPLVVLAALAIPFLTGHGTVSYDRVRGFSDADLAAFRASLDEHWGLVPNLLGLRGFWAERLGRFPDPGGGAVWWPIPAAIVVGLAAVTAWLDRRRRWLLFIGLAGVAVSASTALPGGVDAVGWLSNRAPVLLVYREPQKWSVLWLVALVALVPLAPSLLARRLSSITGADLLRASAGPVAGYILVLSVLAFGAVGAWQVADVVTPVSYPADWEAAARYLDGRVGANNLVAVLPWHAYLTLPFVGRPTANPASVVFPGRLLVPDNIEIPGRLTDDVSLRALTQEAVTHPHRGCRLVDALDAAGVTWSVVENADGSQDDVLTMLSCGYRLAWGVQGTTVVLRRELR